MCRGRMPADSFQSCPMVASMTLSRHFFSSFPTYSVYLQKERLEKEQPLNQGRTLDDLIRHNPSAQEVRCHPLPPHLLSMRSMLPFGQQYPRGGKEGALFSIETDGNIKKTACSDCIMYLLYLIYIVVEASRWIIGAMLTSGWHPDWYQETRGTCPACRTST